jgi:hypothetical protein
MPSKWDDLAFVLSDIRWNEPEVVGHLLRVIKDNVPTNVLMPVPRCETCTYWHGGKEGSNESSDGRKTCVEPTAAGEQMDEFMTLPDFGCVQWKEK